MPDRPRFDAALKAPLAALTRRRLMASGVAAAALPWAALVGGCAQPRVTSQAAAATKRRPAYPAPAETDAAALAPQDLALVNRVTWGASARTAADFSRSSRRDWLQAQLHPGADAALPASVQATIDAFSISKTPFETLVGEAEALRLDSAAMAGRATDDGAKQDARRAYQQALTQVVREAATRSLLRDVHSANQLQEQLTWFWFNHFNVHAYKANLRVMVGDYEDRALRPHALGRFRDLLIASATHPAMLRFLDNAQNAVGRLNENFARELMELHTLGVDGGYSQRDVQELARVLTGLGLARSDSPPWLRPEWQALYVRQGLTEFNPARHDMGEKIVLGQRVAGRGWAEVLGELDRLAAHPSTARHISLKLARFFVADAPSPALLGAMTEAFSSSGGDIAVTLAAMFELPDFAASLGGRFKDPMHYVISALRLGLDRQPIADTQPLLGWLARLGEAPYNRPTPDGYPLDEAAWASPSQMAARFDVAQAIVRVVEQSLSPAAAPRLRSAFFQASIEPTLSASTRSALASATSLREWSVLLLASPDFMLG